MNNENGSTGKKHDYKDFVKKLKLLPFEKRLEVIDHMAKNMSYEEISAMCLSKVNTQIFCSRKHYFNEIQIQALEQELRLAQEMEKQGLNPIDMNDRERYLAKINFLMS